MSTVFRFFLLVLLLSTGHADRIRGYASYGGYDGSSSEHEEAYSDSLFDMLYSSEESSEEIISPTYSHIVQAPTDDEDLDLVSEYSPINKTGQLRYASVPVIENELVNDILNVIFGRKEYLILLDNPEKSEMNGFVREMLRVSTQQVLKTQLLQKILAARAFYNKYIKPMLENNNRRVLLDFGQHLLDAHENRTLSTEDTIELKKMVQNIAFFDRPEDFEFKEMMDKLEEVFGGSIRKNEVVAASDAPYKYHVPGIQTVDSLTTIAESDTSNEESSSKRQFARKNFNPSSALVVEKKNNGTSENTSTGTSATSESSVTSSPVNATSSRRPKSFLEEDNSTLLVTTGNSDDVISTTTENESSTPVLSFTISSKDTRYPTGTNEKTRTATSVSSRQGPSNISSVATTAISDTAQSKITEGPLITPMDHIFQGTSTGVITGPLDPLYIPPVHSENGTSTTTKNASPANSTTTTTTTTEEPMPLLRVSSGPTTTTTEEPMPLIGAVTEAQDSYEDYGDVEITTGLPLAKNLENLKSNGSSPAAIDD